MDSCVVSCCVVSWPELREAEPSPPPSPQVLQQELSLFKISEALLTSDSRLFLSQDEDAAELFLR